MAEIVRFPSTFWTTLLGSPQKARARVYTQYRTPVFNYILNHGFQESDAEDLTQEVFTRVCREEFLKKVDQRKGKFRSLLLAITQHLMFKDRTRRSRGKALSIERDGLDGDAMAIQDHENVDDGFDALWAQNLLRLALQRLMEESTPKGPRYYEALVMHKLQGLPQVEVANKLDTSVTNVNNWVHHGKKRMKEYMREAVRGYSSSDLEYREEITLVSKHLG